MYDCYWICMTICSISCSWPEKNIIFSAPCHCHLCYSIYFYYWNNNSQTNHKFLFFSQGEHPAAMQHNSAHVQAHPTKLLAQASIIAAVAITKNIEYIHSIIIITKLINNILWNMFMGLTHSQQKFIYLLLWPSKITWITRWNHFRYD